VTRSAAAKLTEREGEAGAAGEVERAAVVVRRDGLDRGGGQQPSESAHRHRSVAAANAKNEIRSQPTVAAMARSFH